MKRALLLFPVLLITQIAISQIDTSAVVPDTVTVIKEEAETFQWTDSSKKLKTSSDKRVKANESGVLRGYSSPAGTVNGNGSGSVGVNNSSTTISTKKAYNPSGNSFKDQFLNAILVK